MLISTRRVSIAKTYYEEGSRISIGDGLDRLSVGIEAVEDIINDLDQALTVLE